MYSFIINPNTLVSTRVNSKGGINILRNYKINYSDIIPKPFLVISAYNQDLINIGLEKNNLLFHPNFRSKFIYSTNQFCTGSGVIFM